MRSRTPDESRPPTLTEYALVLLVMGTVGLVGVPRRPQAAAAPQTSSLVTAMRRLEHAVAGYADDHGGDYPGWDARTGELTEEAFVRQLTERTGDLGRTRSAPWERAQLGPYLWEVPANPINGLASVRLVEDHARVPDAPDGTTGWIFHPATGELRANVAGVVPGTTDRFYDL